jgi:hypothetical protein
MTLWLADNALKGYSSQIMFIRDWKVKQLGDALKCILGTISVGGIEGKQDQQENTDSFH